MNSSWDLRAVERQSPVLSPPANLGGEPSPPANFDRLAWVYRWMEWGSFGPFLGWCRGGFLNEMRGRQRALVLGDGDGRFTARLLRTNPIVRVDAVDSSEAMLRALMRRARRHAERLRVEQIDALTWRSGEEKYNLIVTHFFLDCLTTNETRRLAERVRAVSAKGAVWVVSEFQAPPGWFGQVIARPLVTFLYWAFGRLTGLPVRRLPEHRRALQDAGFVLARQRRWLGGLLVSELWQADGFRGQREA